MTRRMTGVPGISSPAVASPRSLEALLALAAVGFAACVAEVAVRVSGAGAPQPTGYAPVNTALRANRRVNAGGYRDPERTLPKPAGVRRLVCLGDSFTWGTGVDLEDAYPHRLEVGLTRLRGERWEAPNLGREGANTVDEAATLAKDGFAYEPDAVLLGYVLNDAEDAGSATERRAARWEKPRYPPYVFWDRSALYRFVGTRLWATRENRARVAEYRALYAGDAPGWQAARKSLGAIGAACRERGIPLVVAIFPLFGNPLGADYPFRAIHAQVGQAATEAGAQVVDLLPAYADLAWQHLVVNGAEDEHPNEVAHRIAAHVLLRRLADVIPDGSAARRP